MKPLCILTHCPLALVPATGQDLPGTRWIEIPQDEPLPDDVHGDVLLTWAWGAPNLAQVVTHGVRWIHTVGTGIDRFPLDAVGDRILSCARGASAVPIAEWTLACMLAFEKNLPAQWIHEPPEHWNRASIGGLRGRTLGLIGLGSIGLEVARLALAFGMRVQAIRRTGAKSPLPEVEIAASLPDLLAAADHLVVAASATAATEHLIDAEALAHVKPGLHLVNIARGTLIDQDALRAALDRGDVALASLDVCEPEPLPAEHWLFHHAQVRLSSHVSWSAPDAIERILETFIDNLHRFRSGEPLEGVVDLERGY